MIHGEALGLRPVEENDLPLIKRWSEDISCQPMLYSPFFLSDPGIRNWHRSALGSSSRMRFLAERVRDRAAVGVIGLEHIDYRDQEAEVAGLIIDPAERRCGWGTQATEILIRYAFEDLHMHRLSARIYSSNAAALKLSEKAGLSREGALRQAIFHNWHFEDLVYVAILREEWKGE